MSDRIKFVLNVSGKCSPVVLWNEEIKNQHIVFGARKTAQFFATHSKQPAPSADAETVVRDFVENTDMTVLAAICAAADSRVIRYVAAVPADCDCLLFYKIPQISTGGDAAELGNGATVDGVQLGMLTLDGGLVKSMYSSVTRVYAPHVTQVMFRIVDIRILV